MTSIPQGQTAHINTDSVMLEGSLIIPDRARGVVIFAHGSGSGRHSPRNKFVAEKLQEEGVSTLLFDLLTEKEDEVYETRFDISLLTKRLIAATKWLENQPEAANLKIGYFGASTGAAAALASAAKFGSEIAAVVSRGGRPDLAWDLLPKVKAPTLLIVGGEDDVVIKLNKKALQEIKSEKKLEVIPGATHLFEEPGALEQVARLATAWFKRCLS
ncbi:MAG: hydrolase [Candidatus Woykebacteria bacterium GWB1_45_5]|uniref:Hydrolase n=2 Tax=Candidatus Woykeibacteriota TaxID=1817899 RepID=A0A1G1W1S2_9BACT|nr:MAG: hydrolase [Candidatus Woykebacteria bacterium GWA1_44_8]OGY23575.1 MAG: hydrolase [Candidatus Woykebacteria bacterium GWB1_45_5]